MAQCQALAERYVGKGKERVLHTGPCVLTEVGHDGDHLPYSLAMLQMSDAAFNQGVDACIAAVQAGIPETELRADHTTWITEALQKVKR